MMPVAKHGDPQVGIDIHLCIVPPGVPTPLPTPHTSIVFDPMDYLPVIGATVTVCGMKRAIAGTPGKVIHIPPGFPFAPLLPESDDEIFMGSATVVADGEPLSHLSHPILGCHVAGMLSPPRKKKKNTNFRNLPTTFNLAIPTNVFVGGPATISMMGMAEKLGFALLGKFAQSRSFKKFKKRVADKFGLKKPGFLRCEILRAEPVNILNGSVSVEQLDFTLPGRIPIQWTRSYRSDNNYIGVCGHGWETLADIRIQLSEADRQVLVYGPSFGLMVFERFPIRQGDEATEFELMDGSKMVDYGSEIQITSAEQLIYCFPKDRHFHDQEGNHCWHIGRIEDRSGNQLSFEYESGRITAVKEPEGRQLTLRYEKERLQTVNMIDKKTKREHRFVLYKYNESEDLTAVIDILEAPYRFIYDQHRMVCHTDRNGLSFHYKYARSPSGDWRVLHAWGEGGFYDYKFEYFDSINERRIRDSLGHVSLIKLDEESLPICEIDPLGGITMFKYDSVGRTTAVTDPEGHRTAFTFDDRGNMVQLMRPDGACIKKAFNESNLTISVTDPNGATWRQKWDSRGRLVEQASPLGNRTHYEYDNQGQLTCITKQNGSKTIFNYDALGNIVTLTDALGGQFHFQYDALGNLLSKKDQLNQTISYVYDPKGRLIQEVSRLDEINHYAYDAEDNLIRITDTNGAVTQIEYVGLGAISRQIHPDGGEVIYQYDSEERLISIKNQRGETYRIIRDSLGRITQEIDYWGQSKKYEYNLSGHLVCETDSFGETTKYETDSIGRITKKSLKDNNIELFKYDKNGNLIEAENNIIKIQRRYDLEGNLLHESQGDFIINNVFDETGNRVLRKSSLGNITRYDFDALGQTKSIRINDKESILFKYDESGNIIEQLSFGGICRTFEYDINNLPLQETVSTGNRILLTTQYKYEKSGNLSKKNDSRCGIDQYTYDLVGQVTSHLNNRGELLQYYNDPCGDRLITRIKTRTPGRDSKTPNPEGEWSREGEYKGVHYKFDRAGNLIERENNGKSMTFRWDGNQRLTESKSTETQAYYSYDPLGRRIFKQTDSYRIRFLWDEDQMIAELVPSISGTSDNRSICSDYAHTDIPPHATEAQPKGWKEYIYYSNSHEPLCVLRNINGDYGYMLFLNNPNGSCRALIDCNGKHVWEADYAAWGELSEVRQNQDTNNFRLQGYYEDTETNLYSARFRYYDAHIGAFISPDPIGLSGGINFYQYAPNSLTWIDPLGLSCKSARIRLDGVQKFYGLNKGDLSRIQKTLERIIDPTKKQLIESKNKIDGELIPGVPDYFPKKKEGSTYKGIGLSQRGKYEEWTVITPGISSRGQRRIVLDEIDGTVWYTHDHYESFHRIGKINVKDRLRNKWR